MDLIAPSDTRVRTTSNLIAVRIVLLEPDDPEVCRPAARSNATACTANEPRCRCPSFCSARPLSDTSGRETTGWVIRERARMPISTHGS
jgi:hypothetical protein